MAKSAMGPILTSFCPYVGLVCHAISICLGNAMFRLKERGVKEPSVLNISSSENEIAWPTKERGVKEPSVLNISSLENEMSWTPGLGLKIEGCRIFLLQPVQVHNSLETRCSGTWPTQRPEGCRIFLLEPVQMRISTNLCWRP